MIPNHDENLVLVIASDQHGIKWQITPSSDHGAPEMKMESMHAEFIIIGWEVDGMGEKIPVVIPENSYWGEAFRPKEVDDNLEWCGMSFSPGDIQIIRRPTLK